MFRDPSVLIDAIAAAPDDPQRARLLHDGARALLAEPARVAALAALLIDPGDSARQEAAAALLSDALAEARMAAENDAPEGRALIARLDTALATQDAARPFAPDLRLNLARIYARAGLVPPPFAMLSAETLPGTAPEAGEMPDIGALLDPILKELGDAPQQVHAALAELLAGLPRELVTLMVSMTVARLGDVEARLGLYWLLDPEPDTRLAAALALLSRAEDRTLAPEIGALLPALRKWLPDEDARAALDGAIRRQLQNRAPPAPGPAPGVQPEIREAFASLPDGAGAQSLIASLRIGGQRAVAMAMLKQGHGVKDAFVIPCETQADQKTVLTRILSQIEAFQVPPEALAEALARGLGEAAELGLLPAPGMVDFAEFLGPDRLVPRPGATPEILGSIGAPEELAALSDANRRKLIARSAEWVMQLDQIDSWFEDTGDLRAAIARARSDTGRETAVWKHLATRRDWWARQIAVSAATLKASSEAPPRLWLSFAAVAQALVEGRALKRVPIMEAIVAMTLAADEDRHEEEVPPLTAPREVLALLARAQVDGAYLEGYLTALAIAPLQPAPADWLVALLGMIGAPRSDLLDPLMQFLMTEANLINEISGDAQAMTRALAQLHDEDLRDWAAGFDDMVQATRGSWPAKRLNAEDKRLLRDLRRAADEGGTGVGPLREVLPGWVARRHALRQ
ncbi:MAG: hypothetical protein EP318_16325 [Rhodobacteraceae bacterium]|nr:MAG: hypothetical protein EP318_16325 [Paracoccaceae bacterium]